MAGTGGEPLSLLARHDHAHLELTAALPPEARRRPKSRGGAPRYPDQAQHAAELRDQATQIRLRHRMRVTVLGVDPALVLILELNRPIDADTLSPRGLDILEATDATAMVAFASDPELTRFLNDLDRYAAGPPTGQRSPPLQGVFDAIAAVREIRPDDVIDSDLRDGLRRLAPAEILRVDIECWCPEDEPEARRRYDEVVAVVTRAGVIVDRSCRPAVGFSMVRADVPAGAVGQLADTKRVRRISRLPRPTLSRVEVRRAEVAALPDALAPARHAPLLAVIDSGVRAEHPLLRASVVATMALGSLDAGTDETGHGTMVASLALYGSLEQLLRSRRQVSPAGRMISIRVLDRDDMFPDDRIWQEDVARALVMAAERGARVVNLSLGDDRHPYRPPGPVPVAAVVDEMARQHDLVVVISSGNLSVDSFPRAAEIIKDYPRWLLGLDNDLVPAAAAGIAPPAMAALALTVGATLGAKGQGARSHRLVVDRVPMGDAGETSPFSRVGPGVEGSVKPELVAPGGSYCFDRGSNRIVSSPDTSVVGAGGSQPDQLLAEGAGTSFAAPLVAHAALRVLRRYPQLSANAVRALVLASARPVPEVIVGGKSSDLADAHRRLAGFGAVDAERAEASSDHRAVLLADGQINVNEVHFYAVPIPRSFFGRGRKWIRVALAHDPPVRATRLKYMANRLSAFGYRGVPIAEVRRRFAAHDGTGEDDDVPQFADRNTITLDPADKVRSRGANQLGVHHSQRRWDSELRSSEIVLAVRCIGRWPVGDSVQRYALAVVLETDETAEPLYAELRAGMRVLTEIEGEIELG